MMRREDFWRLTVSYWPHAVEARLTPQVSAGFAEGEQYYRPHEFDFDNPPSRADFAAVCKMLPWTSVWKYTLFQVIAANDWPVVGLGCKAASVDLTDTQRRVVGRLAVNRMGLWCNLPQPWVHVSACSDLAANIIARRFKPNERQAAKDAVRAAENRMRENLQNLGRVVEEDDVKTEIARVLSEHRKSLRASVPAPA